MVTGHRHSEVASEGAEKYDDDSRKLVDSSSVRTSSNLGRLSPLETPVASTPGSRNVTGDPGNSPADYRPLGAL
jgi:hypothetical protein